MAGPWILVFACCAVLVALASYLIHVNSRLKTVPKELAAVTSQPWTAELIRETYDKYSQVDDDFKKYLPPKQNRRYVVFGGSGERISPAAKPCPLPACLQNWRV